ncbi:MAG TPA: cytochrome c3 family protein [Bryobacteraceae bacterium]|nr:cytochrome c3 family protein [Bryobacteraceae bacterium]
MKLLLVLMASAAAAQNPRPFSHELHLKLPAGLKCASCHAAVASSTRLEDNNLPAAGVCRGCHRQDMRIGQPKPTILSRFNHQKHVAMGNLAPVIRSAIDSGSYLSKPGEIRRHLDTANACAACHRGMEQSAAPARSDFPQMADCLVCHNQIDAPFSCELCHAKGPELKPANHTADFHDSHSRKNSGLDKSTCAVCHGRKFTCLGCH